MIEKKLLSRKARTIRKHIQEDPNVDFGFWVRAWGDGDVWVGPNHDGPEQGRCEKLCARLTALGYEPQMNGKPGTSGEWVIEI